MHLGVRNISTPSLHIYPILLIGPHITEHRHIATCERERKVTSPLSTTVKDECHQNVEDNAGSRCKGRT